MLPDKFVVLSKITRKKSVICFLDSTGLRIEKAELLANKRAIQTSRLVGSAEPKKSYLEKKYTF